MANNSLLTLLQNEDLEQFREQFIDMHPYDQAHFFRGIDQESRMIVYAYLSPKEMASIMENIEFAEAENLITEMEPQFATMVFAEMAVDDAVDIMRNLSIDEVASFLAIMDKSAAEEIKALLHYEEKTAGSMMTTEYVSVLATETKTETLDKMKDMAADAEMIYYTYVLDERKRLVGVLSLRDLIMADDEQLVGEIMNENVVSVSAGLDQKKVANMIRDYDFLAVPVIDFQKHLLGIITVDDVLDVIDEEATDDYSKFAAVSEIDTRDTNPIKSAQRRLPWLIILLFLGMITASLIGSFEDTLEKVPIVAIFIPLIAGMAGNAGTQSLAVAVRGLAVGNYGKDKRLLLIMRELTTGIVVGGVTGVVVVFVIYFWQGNLFLGILVGLTLLTTLTVATLSGSLIPLMMERLKIDPAVASGPFITTLNDITSVIIYFGMATVFMSFLV